MQLPAAVAGSFITRIQQNPDSTNTHKHTCAQLSTHFLSRPFRLRMFAGRPAASAAATSLSDAHSRRSGCPSPAACSDAAWLGCILGTFNSVCCGVSKAQVATAAVRATHTENSRHRRFGGCLVGSIMMPQACFCFHTQQTHREVFSNNQTYPHQRQQLRSHPCSHLSSKWRQQRL